MVPPPADGFGARRSYTALTRGGYRAAVRTVLAALGIASVIGSSGGVPKVQTLYRSGGGPIDAFAQDGSLLAWFAPSSSSRFCNTVHVLSLANGTRVSLPRQGRNVHNVTCRWTLRSPALVQLALAGPDVLWTLHEQSSMPYDYALGAAVTNPSERRFRELAHTSRGAGLWLGGIAGDGDTLVYAVTAVTYVDQVSCLAQLLPRACRLHVSGRGSGIHRLAGRKDTLVRGAGAAAAVAASGRRIAYLPAARVGTKGRPLPAAGGQVPVRDAVTGRLVSRVKLRGVPLALALSHDLLALLVRGSRETRIAWYDPADGRLLGAVAVPRATMAALSASDRFVVFRVGRSIRAVDVAARRVETLATAAATPIGLSIEGTRVAWAENLHGRGRIRALHLPKQG
jgi:hypothetical protein